METVSFDKKVRKLIWVSLTNFCVGVALSLSFGVLSLKNTALCLRNPSLITFISLQQACNSEAFLELLKLLRAEVNMGTKGSIWVILMNSFKN